MILNFFTTALRNFLRNKSFSLINIIGLATGISASLVIFLIVNYDFSFDKFHKDGDRIFRVVSEFSYQGEVSHSSGVTSPLGNVVSKEVTGLSAVSAFRMAEPKVSIPNAKKEKPDVYKRESHIVFADGNYFKIIPYKWMAGSPQSSLSRPYQVVLTESKAKLFFKGLDVAEIPGKEIIFNDTVQTTVTGIVKDIEENTDFAFNIFISRATLETTSLKPDDWEQWGNTTSSSQLVVRLSPDATPSQIEKQINSLAKKYEKQDPNDKSSRTFLLQPLGDIHFNAEFDNFNQRLAHKPTLYGLLVVAAFLLILGCINFINLATANASQRAKEIGIRKTIGSSRLSSTLGS